jgi:hypothetical protein
VGDKSVGGVELFSFLRDNLAAVQQSDRDLLEYPQKEKAMTETLGELERKRRRLYEQMARLGDLRRGTISAGYRRCGKKNCACAKPGHPGHVRYQWSTTTKGNRSVAKTIGLGPALEKASEEERNYREFKRLIREVVEVNEKICEMRPVREVVDEEELEMMKKKLRRQYAGKRRRK